MAVVRLKKKAIAFLIFLIGVLVLLSFKLSHVAQETEPDRNSYRVMTKRLKNSFESTTKLKKTSRKTIKVFDRSSSKKPAITKEKFTKSLEQLPLDMPFDQYCDTISKEWITIDSKVFVRRDSMLFFPEINMIRFFILAKKGETKEYQASIKVYIYQREYYDLSSSDPLVESLVYVDDYDLQVVDVFIKIDTDLSKIDPKIIKMNLKLESTSRQRATPWIDVKLNNLAKKSYNSRKNFLVCSKCFYGETLTHSELKWWIKAIKKSGYDQISVCAHGSVFENDNFNSLFNYYKDFLNVKKLDCIPNLVNEESKYFKSYSKLSRTDSRNFDEAKFELINRLFINECYLTNIDSFQRIAVFDYDEIILPKISSYMSLSLVKDKLIANFTDKSLRVTETTNMNGFVEHLLLENQFQPPQLLYFGMAYYLTDNLVDSIFKQFEIFFKKNPLESVKDNFEYKIEVTDEDRNTDDQFKFEISVKSKSEYIYAKKLLDAHKLIILPFLAANSKAIEKHCPNMNRFLMITGFLNENVPGKSIHDTRESFEITPHFPTLYLDSSSKTVDTSDKYKRPDSSNLQTLPFEQAHVSHLRKVNSFQTRSISIEFFHLDLNYFYGYFVPIINELTVN
jgi:hypothetical protein